jgi:DNA-binding MurR/RpiR family transcriptional regulator
MTEPLLLPERIRLFQDRLSAGHKRVARFILSEPESASRLAAVRIGRLVGVSESTVVRLALRLGYEGFPELQQAIKDTLETRSAPPRPEAAPRKASATVKRSLQADTRNLSETAAALRMEDVERAIDFIGGSDQVHVVGFRTSFSLAYLIYFLVRQLHPRIKLIDDAGGGFAEDIAAMRSGDVLLAVSFPRYIRKTAQTVDYAKAHGIRTIAITDSFLSPIANADVVLYARHESASFFNSNVAATALINALVAELAERSSRATVQRRRQLVEAFYEYELPDQDAGMVVNEEDGASS